MTFWSFARELITVGVAFGAAFLGAFFSNKGADRRENAIRKRDENDAQTKLTTALRLILEDVSFIHGTGDSNAGAISLLERHADFYTQLVLTVSFSGLSQNQIDYLADVVMQVDLLVPFLRSFSKSSGGTQANIAASCHRVKQLIRTALQELCYDGDLTQSIFDRPVVDYPHICPICAQTTP